MKVPSASISLNPIVGKDAQVLILGTMPGIKSLQMQQYYAHPRNVFWSIMASLFSFNLELEYSAKCQQLKGNHIALWDVLRSCQRQGSLDQDIENKSIIPNNFLLFLRDHAQIAQILFNGATAENIFKLHILHNLTI